MFWRRAYRNFPKAECDIIPRGYPRDLRYYQKLISSARLVDFISNIDVLLQVEKICKKIADPMYQMVYEGVQSETDLHWAFIGCIHQLEASGSWRSNLHNGQPWNKVTTWVPKGIGPFNSWDEAAVDALISLKQHISNGTLSEYLRCAEIHNGWGYAIYRKVNSPYIWSGTNHGIGVGKYVKDGKYDPSAVSKQIGIAAILLRGKTLGLWEFKEETSDDLVGPYIVYNPRKSLESARHYQKFLNELTSEVFDLDIDPISVDGKLGKNSSDRHRLMFGDYLDGDPRL